MPMRHMHVVLRAVVADDVEAAAPLCMIWMVGKPQLRSCDEPFALGCGDGIDGTTMVCAKPMPHFNEYDDVSIKHHQIELAMARGVVARQQLEAGALQFDAGALLENRTGGAH